MEVMFTADWWLHYVGFALIAFVGMFFICALTFPTSNRTGENIFKEFFLTSAAMTALVTGLYFIARVGWLLF